MITPKLQETLWALLAGLIITLGLTCIASRFVRTLIFLSQ